MGTPGLSSLDPLAQAQGLGALPAATDKSDAAARQFEGLLMSMLFQTMRKTVEPSGLFGDSAQTRSTFEYLLDKAVADQAMSTGKGWGLAERLKASWAPREKSDQQKEVPSI